MRSVVELGRNLGLTVVAEGVETQEAYDTLAALGCDGAQGYFLSKPVPAHDLASWLRRDTPIPPGLHRQREATG